MNRRRLPLLAAAAALVLSGCGGEEAGSEPPAATPSPTASPTASPTPSPTASGPATQAARGGDTSCLIGRWQLDNADFAAQALAYLQGLGIPATSLDISGTQFLDFRENGHMTIATDMRVDAVVHGIALSEPHQSAGDGEWGWNGDRPDTIGVDGFAWTVEPQATAGRAPVPLFEPSETMPIRCSARRLSIQGVGAPLVGNFVR